MEEISARASLVPAADVSQGLTTSVSRSELEEVLGSDEEPIELILELTQFSDGEAAGEPRSVAVSWERSDLERLLEEATGERVTLTFDRQALLEAATTDVEAHGMRETVLALAVAATAATGAAASASAEPGPFLGTGATSTQVGGPDDRAVSRAAPTPDPVLGVDDRAVPRAAPVDIPTPAPDDRAVPRATPVEFPSPGLAPDDRAVPRATTPVEAPATGSVSDPGSSWSPSPAETAVLVGALALAITGAFFVVGGRRRVRPGQA
jgi:hypothetical protein